MKNFSFTILFTILFTIITFGLLLSFLQCKSDKEKIEDIVCSINKLCPYAPDPTMRMDGAEFIPQKTIKVKFTLLQDIDESEKDFYAGIMQDGMYVACLSIINEDPQMKKLRKMNVIFRFYLITQNNIELANVEITPEEYNKPIAKNSPTFSGDYDNDLEAMLKITAQATKKHLTTLFDDDSEIIITDCEALGKKLIYTICLKDSFLKDIKTEVDREYLIWAISAQMEETIESDHSIKN